MSLNIIYIKYTGGFFYMKVLFSSHDIHLRVWFSSLSPDALSQQAACFLPIQNTLQGTSRGAAAAVTTRE